VHSAGSHFFAFAILILILVPRPAHGETLEVPVGGKAVPLGDGRVACAGALGGWVAEDGGRAVRPPAADSAVGTMVEVRTALPGQSCARRGTPVKLVATGPWPRLDMGSFTLALDEGRLEGKGRGLRGVTVMWPTEGGARAGDVCSEPKGAGTETCTWSVPKTLPGDPGASPLQWLPAGAIPSADEVIFDSDGRRAPAETFALVPGHVEIVNILPSDTSVDVSSGVGRAPLAHAEAIAGVDCAAARCSLENGALAVQAPPASVTSLDVKFRLIAHVAYTRRGTADPQPVLRVAVVRCPMSIASGPILRGTDSARVVLRVGGACLADVGLLRFLAGARHVDVEQIEHEKDAAYPLLNIGNVDTPNVSITAVRGEGEGAVVAVARTETIPAPVVRTVIEIPGFPPIDFIPNNRRGIVHHPRVKGAELVLLSVPDVYDAGEDKGASTVQGDINAAGAVTLQFGYRVPSLPPPLDKIDLAVLSDPLHRIVKEANIPAPIGVSASSAEPLVELICTDATGTIRRVQPGLVAHLSYADRDGCRLMIHRERLSPEYGTQKLSLEVEVDKLDGSPRGDSHVSQTIVMRSGNEPFVAWIKGVHAPYDRAIVRLFHVADEAHYLGALDIATGAPTVQWAVLFGGGHARLYATTAIPTGLYRFGSANLSGLLSLSVAIISRLTWLDSEGHEGLLGLEAGILVFGITDSVTQQTLTQVGALGGLGLSIPIAGAGSPVQASINLHGWFEERLTGSGPEAASERAFIFGPSISVGNIGTTF
jgi:hypothetical protein